MHKLTLKLIWKCKSPRIDKIITPKKENVGELMLPDFKICYKTTVIRTVCCPHEQTYASVKQN